MTKQLLYNQWCESKINKTVTMKDAYFEAHDKVLQLVIDIFDHPPIGNKTALERIERAVRELQK